MEPLRVEPEGVEPLRVEPEGARFFPSRRLAYAGEEREGNFSLRDLSVRVPLRGIPRSEPLRDALRASQRETLSRRGLSPFGLPSVSFRSYFGLTLVRRERFPKGKGVAELLPEGKKTIF